MDRKGILEFMKKCLNNSNFNNEIARNKRVVTLIKNFMSDLDKHYRFLDIEKESNHQRRFYLLYIEKNKMTFEDISEATFISLNKFKQYVRLYNYTALAYVSKESKNNSDFYFLLKQYEKTNSRIT